MNFSPRKLRTSMRVPPSDGTVDGEMRVDSPHLVKVAQGEALEHVLDVAADGSHGGDLLLLAKPFPHLNGLGISPH